MARTGRRRTPAFTLIELLVVIVIILLVSAVTLPAVLPALSHRQVSEAARILQAALVQARDTAIRYNSPRGTRFLPDPTYNYANTGILAYNRMVAIEPGPEYSNGAVTIWPQAYTFGAMGIVQQPWSNPAAPYPANGTTIGGGGSGYYPVGLQGNPQNSTGGQVLVVEQAPFQSNDPTQPSNAPTSWYWNIRLGDQIQIANTGQTYTVVGPCTVNPFSNAGQNPEMFVNVGLPGDLTNYLTRVYTDANGNAAPAVAVEFLYLVNGIDDDGDGYVDNGWDGVDNNQGYVYNGVIDDQGNGTTIPTEWETETWKGTLSQYGAQVPPMSAYITASTGTSGPILTMPSPAAYTITRRPVPSQAARETSLPNNVAIDVTTWNSTSERSRLPVDPFSGYADILVLPNGQVVPTTAYSSPASFTLGDSFYHFWIAERTDIHSPKELWGSAANPNTGLSFILPMPQDAYNAYGLTNFSTTQPQISLTGERMLVTLFSRTGQITANSIEFFACGDVNMPYYDSQLGAREAK